MTRATSCAFSIQSPWNRPTTARNENSVLPSLRASCRTAREPGAEPTPSKPSPASFRHAERIIRLDSPRLSPNSSPLAGRSLPESYLANQLLEMLVSLDQRINHLKGGRGIDIAVHFPDDDQCFPL